MTSPLTIALIGTLDTKAEAYAFIKQCIESQGYQTLLINVGHESTSTLKSDISDADLFKITHQPMIDNHDRGKRVAQMSEVASQAIQQIYQQTPFHGILAVGGSGGTSIACAAMRNLPLELPKIMISTMAATDVSDYLGTSNIIMFPSIVDIAGLNSFCRDTFNEAAHAICAMASCQIHFHTDKSVIAASMFGNTTDGIEYATRLLEEAGYEVLVFHATGTGGKTMERFIRQGLVQAVFDLTTTELADELVGGILSAGPARLSAATQKGIPALIAPGCLDMVNFGPKESVPKQFKDRLFYQHNPDITLMRTNIEENHQLGKIMADKLNQSAGPVTVLFPLKGLSEINMKGKPFYWPEADKALLHAIKKNLNPNIPLIEMDEDINSPIFIQRCVAELLKHYPTN